MQNQIPNGLRTTFLIHFIWEAIFGLAGTLAPRLVGAIAGHPVHDLDVNMLLGVAALTFALASWFAYRALHWEQISILTAAESFFNLLGGLGGILIFFAPSLFGIESLPPVQLLISVILVLFGLAFAFFYNKVNGLRPPI
jgi:ABC-type polysaccharide/polyol phosphate export permease